LPADAPISGLVESQNLWSEFIDYVLSLIDVSQIKNFKIHADTANGMVGPFLEILSQKLPTIEFV